MRVALVTGAARGLGLAAAEALAADGFHAIVLDRDADGVTEAVTALRDGRASADGFELDVTDSAAVNAVVAEVEADVGPIAALVNNAGILRDGPLVDMTDDDFDAVVRVCLYGTFNLSRAVAPFMIERRSGRIVNIASRAWTGNPGQANYSAAKAGIVGLTKSMAKELGRHSITVNAIAPGLIETDMVRAHPKFDRLVERASKANSIPRLGEPSEVGAAISYLCSPGAGFVTGEVLHVSGGRFS